MVETDFSALKSSIRFRSCYPFALAFLNEPSLHLGNHA